MFKFPRMFCHFLKEIFLLFFEKKQTVAHIYCTRKKGPKCRARSKIINKNIQIHYMCRKNKNIQIYTATPTSKISRTTEPTHQQTAGATRTTQQQDPDNRQVYFFRRGMRASAIDLSSRNFMRELLFRL